MSRNIKAKSQGANPNFVKLDWNLETSINEQQRFKFQKKQKSLILNLNCTSLTVKHIGKSAMATSLVFSCDVTHGGRSRMNSELHSTEK